MSNTHKEISDYLDRVLPIINLIAIQGKIRTIDRDTIVRMFITDHPDQAGRIGIKPIRREVTIIMKNKGYQHYKEHARKWGRNNVYLLVEG